MTIKVLGYGRVSTDKQTISTEVQELQCRQWYKIQCEFGEFGQDSKFIGMIVDKAISGKVDLFKRPQGQHVLTTLSRGDVLVVSKLSRAFRSTRDALKSVEVFNEMGIRLVLLDIQVDTSKPIGRMLLTMLSAVAELEREQIAERTRDAIQHRMAEGQWLGIAPPGWTLRTKSQTRRRNNDLVPDPDTRQLGLYAAKRIKDGASVELIAAEVNGMANKSTESRSLKRRQKQYSAKLMCVWAAYCICDWPPFSRKKMVEKFGQDLFTTDYVRKHYAARLTTS